MTRISEHLEFRPANDVAGQTAIVATQYFHIARTKLALEIAFDRPIVR